MNIIIKDLGFFFVLYIFSKFFIKDNKKNSLKNSSKNTYLICLFHAIYISYNACKILYNYNYDFSKSIVEQYPEANNLILFLVSYLIFDIIIMIYENTVALDFMIHHISCSLILYLIVINNRFLYYGLILLTSEISSIPLNIIKITKNKKIKKINYILFAITFFIFRTILIPIIYLNSIINYKNIIKDNLTIICFLLFTIHLLVNIYWTSKIIKIIKRKN